MPLTLFEWYMEDAEERGRPTTGLESFAAFNEYAKGYDLPTFWEIIKRFNGTWRGRR